jgi:CRISPR-associated endonuclease Cas2
VGELLERACTEQRLLDAWAGVRDAALADGVAGPEIEQFEAAAARHVSQLAAALASGTFEPHPVVRVEIAKPGGGVRKLAVPVLADRIVERALLAELDPVIDPLLLPWSFAYRHGLTLLSGYGPRVQLSVFECDLRSRREAAALRSKLRELIDPVEDQVRLYPLDDRSARRVAVIGARVIEERQDFWIVT